MSTSGRLRVLVLISTLLSVRLAAQETIVPPSDVDALERKGYTAFAVAPIFSQIVAVRLPQGFRPTSEQRSANAYVNNSVPQGESTDNWTQMISLRGERNAANTPGLFPEGYLVRVGEALKARCPQSFLGHALGRLTVNGHNAVAVLVGCGAMEANPTQSETAFIVVIKGRSDIYAIQWSERGAAQTRLVFDEQKWRARFVQLAPAVCDPLEKEEAPYPSCTSRAGQQ
jgi:hypothetical protein